MKKYMVVLPLSAITLFVGLPAKAHAQLAIAEVIKAGVKKVIKAVDLKVQRLQNETIWLQNAQKVLENQLSKLKLTEISDWTSRQKSLYEGYYQELWKVKSLISYYKKIKELSARQVALVEEYRWAWNLLSRNSRFSPQELAAMGEVYQGILQESVKNLDLVFLVLDSFRMQLDDAERLKLISSASAGIEENYRDLKKFNLQQMQLSLQRAASLEETAKLKELYGID
ncbi:MAG: conjugal transfer protein TraI [Chitinophagaceae bacterium]|nr:MAG: conjugal transfer protein TraI [Chitinophagaceae bacterium]